MPINASIVKLQALASEVRILAAASSITISAEVNLQLLKADAIVGFFITFIRLNDGAVASDLKLIQIAKVLSHTVTSTEILIRSLDKALIDIRYATDAQTRSISKPLADPVTASDLPAKSFTRAPIFDSVSQSDVVSLNPEKNLVEIQYNIEGPATGQNYVDPTYFAQDYSYDGFPTKLFNKSLLDSVDATDDFYGEANVDDDQVVFVNKSVADNATTSETLGKTFTRPGVVDSFAASDLSVREAGKSLTETKVTSDSLTEEFNKALTETSNFSDLLVRQYFKALSDSSITSDARVFELAKSLSDSASAADAAVIAISRSLSDSSGSSDIAARAAGKGLTDTGTTSDSGNFRKTDYTDVNYFAEDYVGTSVNF